MKLTALAVLLSFLQIATATAPGEPMTSVPEQLAGLSSFIARSPIEVNTITQQVTLTAYSSTVDQTDDSPFITASNTMVRDGIIAANFLPFGTKVQIPSLFGEKVFVVEDRMHSRFNDRIDIWFPDRATAKQFGKREATVVIYEA
jgi:3D (Asp-Asp-Asp) domain-containing protein